MTRNILNFILICLVAASFFGAYSALGAAGGCNHSVLESEINRLNASIRSTAKRAAHSASQFEYLRDKLKGKPLKTVTDSLNFSWQAVEKGLASPSTFVQELPRKFSVRSAGSKYTISWSKSDIFAIEKGADENGLELDLSDFLNRLRRLNTNLARLRLQISSDVAHDLDTFMDRTYQNPKFTERAMSARFLLTKLIKYEEFSLKQSLRALKELCKS